MLDKLHLFIPFAIEHIQLLGVDGAADPVHMVDLEALGVPLQGQISRGEDGQLQADYLRHTWESLSTGFTPLAFKVFHQSLGKRLMPGIEVKASPAKLLQGHNVYGPTSINLGAQVMLKWIAGTYPDLFSKLDVSAAQVYTIDCTYSSRLPDERTALQVIKALMNVTNGHTKSRGDNYETTAYWGAKDSRLKRLKAYLKYPEFLRQLEDAKRAGRSDLSAARTVKVLSNPDLQEWAKNLLRMEATVMHRWLERRGIPSRLVDLIAYQQGLEADGRCLIQECWQAVTADLFAAFEGAEMRVIDDEKVLDALVAAHPKYDRKGKPNDSYARNLFRTYRSLKDYGWEETQASMARRTFYDHVRDIQAAGLSKAQLQKLQEHDRATNVVPLLRFVQVDFGAQRPAGYVEPSVEAA
ncbi:MULTISPECIES: phage/plasmid replication protein, II/X family [unclassified Pseudomonas]|uniref:phage/plasmid replication protein, II/X family n=1 Tax=unclassified Pseudomonas TaxID=196821 RepID=UPI0007319D5C|nr:MULTISPECIES: phage/plasmid replication protein, II/X family [unclassified Pseudomonas]KSW28402.1 replication initiation protein [Pseudomonas sp. ADP]OBP10880.1 replication initiation protein [Pseudomonas sp. EGD-AKN5]QOF84701.1 replication initiation protein [Pseudomonas sp. ADPe]